MTEWFFGEAQSGSTIASLWIPHYGTFIFKNIFMHVWMQPLFKPVVCTYMKAKELWDLA